MEVSKITLHELLEGARQYQIPPFQRKYSWDEKNWNMLWEDLMDIYNGEIKSDYFMGTIVTESIPASASGASPYIVIDGQQRLITISLLLAAIRNRLKSNGNIDLANEINRLYLVNNSKDYKNYHKISFPYGRSDWAAYKSIIEEKNTTGNIIRYTSTGQAFKVFESRLGQLDADTNINEIKDVIISKLIFVDITIDDRDNPYLIFASLNNKGLQLEQSDLIRNYIFMQSSRLPERLDILKEWHLLEEKFSQKESDEYIKNKETLSLTQYFWTYLRKEGISVPEKEIYKCMILDFDSAPCKYQYLKELNRFSDYYERLCSPEKEPQKGLAEYFNNLLSLDFKTCHIFLLNIYDLYEDSKVSLREFEEILSLLESYFVRRLFTGYSTSILGKIFDNLYKEVCYQGSSNIFLALKLTLKEYSGNKIFPQDKDFKTHIIINKIYKNKGDNRRLNFILTRLEKSFVRNTKEANYISHNLTIEHIMPQSFSIAGKLLNNNIDRIHPKWLHTLGNLTLTLDNSVLSNHIFFEKKKLYSESNLNLNKYFKNIDIWNEKSIEDRAHYLADLAIKIWPMP